MKIKIQQVSIILRRLVYGIAAFLIVATPVFNMQPASAAMSATPSGDFPTSDGRFRDVAFAPDGSRYIGGDFSRLNPDVTTRQAVYDTDTALSTGPLAVPSSSPLVSISDGNGGWYIGGSFTSVGGVTRNRLARISADGSLDNSFNPNVGGTVRALALNAGGNVLYVGGEFTSVNGGTTRNRIAAVSATTGTVTAFNPNASTAGSQVNALALDTATSTLYVGGSFTTIGGASRARLAALSTATGLATSFNPNINSAFTQVSSLALDTTNSVIYAGGNFTSVNGGTARNYVAAFNTSTGTATSFDVSPNSLVNTVYYHAGSSVVYVGGGFSTVNGSTSRSNLAAVHPSTGVATSFNPRPNGSINTLAYDTTNDRLYAAGGFTLSDGNTRNYLAKLNVDGSIDDSFAPELNGAVQAFALNRAGTVLYIGGEFSSIDGEARNQLAAIDLTTGELTDFNPNTDDEVNSLVLSPDGQTLYAGGDFYYVNGGVERPYLAAFDTQTGGVTAFNPNPNSTVYEIALTQDGQTLYAGGGFGEVNSGTTRNFAAAFNTSTGVANDFNPNFDWEVVALELDEENNVIYAGGDFYEANGGVSRPNIAALDAGTGVVTDFNPQTNNTVYDIVKDSNSDTIYAAGRFTTVNGGTTRNYTAAFDTNTGTATSFDPNMDGFVYDLHMSPEGRQLIASGYFTTIGGASNYSTALFEDTDIPPDYDGDGVTNASEDAAPNSGDGNNDGTPDSEQNHVISVVSSETGEYVTIVSPEGTTITATSPTPSAWPTPMK